VRRSYNNLDRAFAIGDWFMRVDVKSIAVALTAISVMGLCARSTQAWAAEDASSYPSKAVHIIMPFAPGGPTDILARLVADELAARWKASVVVDSRPGGGTIIATQLVARSDPDGYTLLMASISTAANLSLKKSLPYDTLKDFAPVVRLAEAPNILVVNVDSPIHSVADLIAAAKSSPGNITYGSAGTGTATDLACLLLGASSGVKLVGVHYKGDVPALLDVLGSRITWMFGTALPTMPHVTGGKLRAIAVSGSQRSPVLPDVPTVAETIPGFSAVSWFGIFAPAGTPPDIVAKLNAEIGNILKSEKVSAFLKSQGTTPVGGDPETFSVFFKSEIEKWSKVIKDAGIEPE
jgi:tripartite-type tricarboxylate transporter receptor subunit TctC